MAISDALYGGNPFGFLGRQVTIGTQTYTAQGLQRYIEDYGDLIKQENVISRLRAFRKAKATNEVLNDDYVLMAEEEQPENRDILYIGNALSVALRCKEYELAEQLAKSGVALRDGQVVTVWKSGEGVFHINEIVTDSVMGALLQKGDMPEDVWYALWENYSALDYKLSRKRFLPDAELKTVYRWLENLALLKEKRPELWERVATEELKCELLWTVTWDKKVMSKQNLIKFCKALKEAELIPERQRTFWSVLTLRYKNENEPAKDLIHAERYLQLWKTMTKQPVILDWDSSECNELDLPEMLDMICEHRFDANYAGFEWWLKHVDMIVNSETANWESLISFGLQDEANLILALKSNLLPAMLLPEAINRARKSAKAMLPLLIMKQHGEFDYDWEEG